jgi:hypothetical protein
MKKMTKLERGQLAALNKRLASGKPLTSAQMQFVQRLTHPGADDTSADDADVVANASALAQRLGVSRQSIAWHRGRAGAPKDFSVSAWRSYMLAHGKGATIDRVASSAAIHHDNRREGSFNLGILSAARAIGEVLGKIIPSSLETAGIAADARQCDRATVSAWLFLCAKLHSVATRHGCEDSPLNPDYNDNLNEICPEEIQQAAARIGYDIASAIKEVQRILKIQGFGDLE